MKLGPGLMSLIIALNSLLYIFYLEQPGQAQDVFLGFYTQKPVN